LKNISPTLWVGRYKHPNSTNISTLLGVHDANINPSEGSPLAPPAHFQWRRDGKNADALCDGIGLGMLSKNSPSKGRILKEDIPDIKAFFSCVEGHAKSHLKWAEAVWLLFREKVTKRMIENISLPMEFEW